MTTGPVSTKLARSIDEVSAATGIGRDGIYSAIREGRLEARKFGKRTIITDEALTAFLADLPLLNLPDRGS